MIRSTSLILSILFLQLMIALYFMLQCYDGNFFVVNNEQTEANSPVFYRKVNENHKQNRSNDKTQKCYSYNQECLKLFSQLKSMSNRKLKLKTFDVIKNELLEEIALRLDSNPNLELISIMKNYSEFIQNKKLIILSSKSDDFLIEVLAIKYMASKLLRLDFTKRPKLFQIRNMEWLNINEYLNYLSDLKILEQYDNLFNFARFKSIKLNDLFDLVHCLIKPNGLFVVNLNDDNEKFDEKLSAWSFLAKHSFETNTTQINTVIVLKKKTLC